MSQVISLNQGVVYYDKIPHVVKQVWWKVSLILAEFLAKRTSIQSTSELTHWGGVTHTCFNKQAVLGLVTSHYLNQCSHIGNWIYWNTFTRILSQNSSIFIHGYAIENVTWKIVAIVLTLNLLEKHGCILSTVVTNTLVLKHQPISTHRLTKYSWNSDTFHVEMLHIWRTVVWNEIILEKNYPFV